MIAGVFVGRCVEFHNRVPEYEADLKRAQLAGEGSKKRKEQE